MNRITLRELNRATLARQMLLAREKVTAAAAIEQLVAMQAQVARPPFVGLWTRVAGFTREDLARLFATRKVVRATALRGTLHVMTSRDFVKLRGAMQPALTAGLQSILRDRTKGLDVAALNTIARRKFDQAPCGFADLRDIFLKRFPNGDERAMAYTVRMHLPVVQVPTDDPWSFPGSADFACAETWLDEKIDVTDDGPDELVKRYLAAFGPATAADVQTWSFLSGITSVLDRLRPKLVTMKDERGRELFDLPKAPRPPADTPAPVRFLPDFDNLVLSHADRTRLIADVHRPKVTSKNLQVAATILVDGMVAGTWKIERKKATATLKVSPFGPFSKKVKEELAAEGEALVRFTEPDATAAIAFG